MTEKKIMTYDYNIEGMVSAIKQITIELEKLMSPEIETKVEINRYSPNTRPTIRANFNKDPFELLVNYMSKYAVPEDKSYIKFSDFVEHYNKVTQGDETLISMSRLMKRYIEMYPEFNITKTQATRDGISGTYFFGFHLRD